MQCSFPLNWFLLNSITQNVNGTDRANTSQLRINMVGDIFLQRNGDKMAGF